MKYSLRAASALLMGTLMGWAGAAGPAGQSSGLDLAGIDRSIKPGDDFFAYANGQWLKSNSIPPDLPFFGSLLKLREASNLDTRELLEAAGRGAAPAESVERKAADYFAAFMDEAGIEAKGLTQLQPLLARIAAINDSKSLARALGESLRADVDPLNNTNFYTENLFGFWVGPNMRNGSRYTAYLLQGGLGMPDREYYLSDNPKMADTRAKYLAHIAAVLKLAQLAANDEAAQAKARSILDLEQGIAKAHVSREDSGDVRKANNPWRRGDFPAKAPGLDWQAFFAAARLDKQSEIVVWQPAAVTGIAKLVGEVSPEIWRDYLAYHALNQYSPYLPKAFADEHFAFNGKTLSGTPQQRERWKRGVDDANASIGEAVGQLYVRRHFSPESKARVQAMVQNIKRAFETRLDALQWMSPSTRAEAKRKLASLYVGIGYPDHWRDYSGLKIERSDALGNRRRAEQFNYDYWRSQLGRPLDRAPWAIAPQVVNALNLPAQNALNFPAAILQKPCFDPNASAAVNYGAIGAIIGHEISHSFDNLGSQFDSHNRLFNWWTSQDREHFEAATERLVRQYDAYRPFPDAAVNGHLTLSENIADVAGLAAAHDGWLASLQGKPAPQLDGYTPEQQFFLSYGQSWRVMYREPALRRQLLTNEHSPGMYRVATVRNLDSWYAAFDVQAQDKLYLPPAQRVAIW